MSEDASLPESALSDDAPPAEVDPNGADPEDPFPPKIDPEITALPEKRWCDCAVVVKSTKWLIGFVSFWSEIVDIATDVAVYREFKRVFPNWEKPVWQGILLGSMILPHLVLGFIIARREGYNRWNAFWSLPFWTVFVYPFFVLGEALNVMLCGHCSNFFNLDLSISEYAVLKDVAMTFFEDIPQLVVQFFIFVSYSQETDFNLPILLVGCAVTVVHLIYILYRLHGKATQLEGISMLGVTGYLLGTLRPDDKFATALASQIEKDQYEGWDTLNFRGGLITDEGCKAVAKAIRHVTVSPKQEKGELITRVLFQRNRFGDEGVEYWAEALEEPGCQLEELRLQGNPISAVGYQRLSKALDNNGTLKMLHVSTGDEEAIQALVESHGERVKIH